MPSKKITDLTTTTPATADIIELVDVSDTTDAPTGSSRQATLNDLPVSSATATALAGKAASSHSHAESDVTNLTTDLASKQASNTKLTAIAALANAAGALTNDGAGNFSYAAAGGGGGSVAGSNYFKAYASANNTTSNQMQFNTIVSDTSGVYDIVNFCFTAPATGIYYFETHINISVPATYCQWNFTNTFGTVLNAFEFLDSYSNVRILHGSCTLPLNAGDKVDVQQSAGSFITTLGNGNKYTNFSGFRIA